MDYEVKYYEEPEELVNVWSHALGFLLSVMVFPLLLIKAIGTKDTSVIVSYFIYGVSMMVLYAASTLYHSAFNKRIRYYLNILDHSAVYVLIAGSYAPISLVVLGGKIGWLVFGISWGIAILGILFKIYFIGRFKLFSVLSYVLMGWLIVFFLKPLVNSFSVLGLQWLLWGGIFYSIGAVFFAFERLKYNHAIFHIFVLLGSFCHFIAIYFHTLT